MRSPDKYEAPRAAILMAAAALGGATVAETVSVQPASAAIEAHVSHEALGSKAYMAQLDANLNALTHEILKTPGHKAVKAKTLLGGKLVEATFIEAQRPTKGHPGHVDIIGVMIPPGQTKPNWGVLDLNYSRYKNGAIKSGVNIAFDHLDKSEITLSFDYPHSQFRSYRVGLHRSKLGAADGIDYIDQPGLVGQEFNQFFAQAKNIIK